MRACPESQFGWIRDGVDELVPVEPATWKGNFVTHLLPPRFGAYAKILHRITLNSENIDRLPTDPQLAKIPPCGELRSFAEAHRQRGESPRLRWRQLADLLGVPYAAEICQEWFGQSLADPTCWTRFLRGPEEGNLDLEELAEVIRLLQPFTGGQEIFLRFAAIPFSGTPRPILFAGQLPEIVAFLKEGGYRLSPEYLWPAGETWCLCSDYDLMFTVVGGPQELIRSVLGSDFLEAIEVTPRTRIDGLAPRPPASVGRGDTAV